MADEAGPKPPKPAREETTEEKKWRREVDKEEKKYVKFATDKNLAGWRHFPKGILVQIAEFLLGGVHNCRTKTPPPRTGAPRS